MKETDKETPRNTAAGEAMTQALKLINKDKQSFFVFTTYWYLETSHHKIFTEREKGRLEVAMLRDLFENRRWEIAITVLPEAEIVNSENPKIVFHIISKKSDKILVFEKSLIFDPATGQASFSEEWVLTSQEENPFFIPSPKKKWWKFW
ncbi:MAG: hypothetical protein IAF38_21890 [Bacteroidia bacterium]|nr:hypothetical protein [Bacteroidia bacterium]